MLLRRWRRRRLAPLPLLPPLTPHHGGARALCPLRGIDPLHGGRRRPRAAALRLPGRPPSSALPEGRRLLRVRLAGGAAPTAAPASGAGAPVPFPPTQPPRPTSSTSAPAALALPGAAAARRPCRPAEACRSSCNVAMVATMSVTFLTCPARHWPLGPLLRPDHRRRRSFLLRSRRPPRGAAPRRWRPRRSKPPAAAARARRRRRARAARAAGRNGRGARVGLALSEQQALPPPHAPTRSTTGAVWRPHGRERAPVRTIVEARTRGACRNAHRYEQAVFILIGPHFRLFGPRRSAMTSQTLLFTP